MDQSFTIKNLKKIMNEDREKGGDLEKTYIPNAFKIREKIFFTHKKVYYEKYRNRKGLITNNFFNTRIFRLKRIIEKLRERHNIEINSELERVSLAISDKSFRLDFSVNQNITSGKTTYSIKNSLEQILAVRFVQWILKTIYGIKIPSRDNIISQLKCIIFDGVPKYIIRADVDSFYESVRHKDLLERIHQSPELSALIKKILSRLLVDFEDLTGNSRGLPRGIGVSAYLSEIYLSSIDSEIRKQVDIYYYARYVDDIVMVYAPSSSEIASKYIHFLREILQKKGLSLNASKTEEFDLLSSRNGRFEYLGYHFDVSNIKKGVTLSRKKEEKYEGRIQKAFVDYSAKSKYLPKKAEKELFLRCMFLTGNIRLFNRKSNAFIGVYFSNKHINNKCQLVALDAKLTHQINLISNQSLQKRLRICSFVKGFDERVFRNFDSKIIAEISQGWKHV